MFRPAVCRQGRALNGDTPRQRSMVPGASARGSKSVLDLSIKAGRDWAADRNATISGVSIRPEVTQPCSSRRLERSSTLAAGWQVMPQGFPDAAFFATI